MVPEHSLRQTACRFTATLLAVGTCLTIVLGESRQAIAHESPPLLVEIALDQPPGVLLHVRLDLAKHLSLWESSAANEHSEAAETHYEKLLALPTKALEEKFQQAFLAGFRPVHLVGDRNRRIELSLNAFGAEDQSIASTRRTTGIIFGASLTENDDDLRLRSGIGNVAMLVSRNDSRAEQIYVRAGEVSGNISLTGRAHENRLAAFGNYLIAGFSHILPKGFDHVLFVIGLVLLAPGWKRLALQVSLFTLAHSLTLVLGVLGLVSVPGAIVEPLIAASIIYVCLDNLRAAGSNRLRGLVIILFGMLHGLGFASVLATAGLQAGALAEALFAFNLGIELAQLAVVLVVTALFGVLQRYSPLQTISVATSASVAIGIAGTGLLFARVIA